MSDDGAATATPGTGSTPPASPPSSAFGAAGQSDPLASFIQEQPFTAALAAMIVGYFLGKIT